jgi:hypothetical protein
VKRMGSTERMRNGSMMVWGWNSSIGHLLGKHFGRR